SRDIILRLSNRRATESVLRCGKQGFLRAKGFRSGPAMGFLFHAGAFAFPGAFRARPIDQRPNAKSSEIKMAAPQKPSPNVRSSLGLLEVICISGIMPIRQIEEIQTRVRDGSYPDDVQALAARLVKKAILTGYQARHFLHGQWEGLLVGRYLILDLLGRGAM